MSRNLPHAIGLILLALTLGFVAPVAPNADAGTWVPIFEEELVASVHVDDCTYVALPHKLQQLEYVYGVSGSIDTLANTIADAPAASSANEFVMHGCKAAGGAVGDLEDRGYDTSTEASSSFPGCSDDMIYTD